MPDTKILKDLAGNVINIDPANASEIDISDLKNESSDPFVKESDIAPIEEKVTDISHSSEGTNISGQTTLEDANVTGDLTLDDESIRAIINKKAAIQNTQAQFIGGTYPRLLKYNDTKLYIFLDNRYRISLDGGKTWSEETIIFTKATENEALGRNDIDDVANAYPALLDDSGRIVVFYRCHSRANSYYSIVARVSDNTGANFTTRQELFHSASGYWEPFYYEGYVYYSSEHNGSGPDKAQSQYRRTISLNSDSSLTVGTSKKFIDGRNKVNMDGEVNALSRIGMLSAAPLKNGYHIFVFESSVNNTASQPRPMVVQYCYVQDPTASSANPTTATTIFMGSVNKSCGAPYVTVLTDGRVVISFQSNQDYTGYITNISHHTKRWVAYVSKKVVNYGDTLTADDFIPLKTFDYAENEYGCWGSVSNIDGILYKTFSAGINTSTSSYTTYGSFVQPYFDTLENTIPECKEPTDGLYRLVCSVDGGYKTYEWKEDNSIQFVANSKKKVLSIADKATYEVEYGQNTVNIHVSSDAVDGTHNIFFTYNKDRGLNPYNSWFIQYTPENGNVRLLVWDGSGYVVSTVLPETRYTLTPGENGDFDIVINNSAFTSLTEEPVGSFAFFPEYYNASEVMYNLTSAYPYVIYNYPQTWIMIDEEGYFYRDMSFDAAGSFDWVRPVFTDSDQPRLMAHLEEITIEAYISAAVCSERMGATAVSIRLEKLYPRNLITLENLEKIAHSVSIPVMAIFYDGNVSQEIRLDMLKVAAEAGCSTVDLQGFMYWNGDTRETQTVDNIDYWENYGTNRASDAATINAITPASWVISTPSEPEVGDSSSDEFEISTLPFFAYYGADPEPVMISGTTRLDEITYTYDSEYLSIVDNKVSVIKDISGTDFVTEMDFEVTATLGSVSHSFTVRVKKAVDREGKVAKYIHQQDVHGVTAGDYTIILGDSFFDFYYDRGWPRIYEDISGSVLASGIGASTFEEWFCYASKLIYPLSPKYIAMHLGTNDMWTLASDKEYTFNKFVAFVERIHYHCPNTRIVCFSIESRGDAPLAGKTMAETVQILQEYNAMVEDYCDEHDFIRYVDSFTHFANADGTCNTALFYDDKLHPLPSEHPFYIEKMIETGINNIGYIQGTNFDMDFVYSSPVETILDPIAIAWQKEYIRDIHYLGGEVTLSSHNQAVYTTNQSIKYANFIADRGVDIIKVVAYGFTKTDVDNCIHANTNLRGTITNGNANTKFTMHLNSDSHMRITRLISPLFYKAFIAFCYETQTHLSMMHEIATRLNKPFNPTVANAITYMKSHTSDNEVFNAETLYNTAPSSSEGIVAKAYGAVSDLSDRWTTSTTENTLMLRKSTDGSNGFSIRGYAYNRETHFNSFVMSANSWSYSCSISGNFTPWSSGGGATIVRVPKVGIMVGNERHMLAFVLNTKDKKVGLYYNNLGMSYDVPKGDRLVDTGLFTADYTADVTSGGVVNMGLKIEYLITPIAQRVLKLYLSEGSDPLSLVATISLNNLAKELPTDTNDIYYCGNVAEVYMNSDSAGTNNPVYFTNISTDPLN